MKENKMEEGTKLLKEVLIEKMKIEFMYFIRMELVDTDLRKKSINDIELIATEIVTKRDIINIIEEDEGLGYIELRALNLYDSPLEQIYSDWLDKDDEESDEENNSNKSEIEQLIDCVSESISATVEGYLRYDLPNIKEMNYEKIFKEFKKHE